MFKVRSLDTGSKFSTEFRLTFFLIILFLYYYKAFISLSEGLTYAKVALQSPKQGYYCIPLRGGGREMLIRN